MAVQTESHEGCRIRVEDDSQVTIDGKQIDCEFDPAAKKWSSRYLPYTQYDSLLDMAKDIARYAAEFRR